MNNPAILENAELIKNYFLSIPVEKIGIFGSYSRNQQDKDSDLDLLVKFKNNISLFRLSEIETELSEILGVKVDLITENSIRNKRILTEIEKEIIYL